MSSITRITDLPALPPRPHDAHKGTFGHVRVLAGSLGMSGAAVLSATAALRAGAGTVLLAVPHAIRTVVAAAQPCYTTCELPLIRAGRFGDNDRPKVLQWAECADALAIGPGLGMQSFIVRTVRSVVEGCTKPIVLDADGINAFAPLSPGQKVRTAGPTVMTPHPGELARLTGTTTADVQADREGVAVRFASEQQLVLVLKGAGTVVTDGSRLYVNATGNPGMATGGAGDVLTGTIAALLAQGLDAFEAAQFGVWLHGKAGDLAAADLGEDGLIATDLLDYLPRAWKEVRT